MAFSTSTDFPIYAKLQEKTCTVLRLDFSLAKDFSSISEFAKFFEYMLEDAAGRAHLSVPKKAKILLNDLLLSFRRCRLRLLFS